MDYLLHPVKETRHEQMEESLIRLNECRFAIDLGNRSLVSSDSNRLMYTSAGFVLKCNQSAFWLEPGQSVQMLWCAETLDMRNCCVWYLRLIREYECIDTLPAAARALPRIVTDAIAIEIDFGY